VTSLIPEEALVALDREKAAHRLLDASGRELDQRPFHRRDQLVPAQVRPHVVFVEKRQHDRLLSRLD